MSGRAIGFPRPVHCPSCAREGKPAIPAEPCAHMTGPSCDCGSRWVVTEIEAESQGRGSPPLYRCLTCGAQWGRD